MATPRGARHTDLEQRLRDLEGTVRRLSFVANFQNRVTVPGQVVNISQILTDPNAAVSFRNVDTLTATGGGDQPFLLTYRPANGSEHVTWYPAAGGGIRLPASAWTRSGHLVTVLGFDGLAADDVLTCEYAYFPGDTATPPTIVYPEMGATVADTTPTISGTGEPGFTASVEVDGTPVGTAAVAADGSWSVTPGTALAPGGHTVTVEQSHGVDASGSAASTFTTPAVTPPTLTPVGSTSPGTWDSVASTQTFTLPPGTPSGGLIAVTARGDVGPGGGETVLDVTCSDPRMVLAYKATGLNGAQTIVESVFVGFEDGSGDPVVLDVVRNPSYTATVHGRLATFSGVNGYGVVSAVESGTTTPVVGGVAAVAVTWVRGGSFTTVNAAPPTGYTDVGSTGASYSSTDISYWYDLAGTDSPAGTFVGEGCCVIAIV